MRAGRAVSRRGTAEFPCGARRRAFHSLASGGDRRLRRERARVTDMRVWLGRCVGLATTLRVISP